MLGTVRRRGQHPTRLDLQRLGRVACAIERRVRGPLQGGRPLISLFEVDSVRKSAIFE
jgi:hypothetical protein